MPLEWYPCNRVSNPESEPKLEEMTHPNAEGDELEDIEDQEPQIDENLKSPKIKDLLLSPDYPSRYLTILSFLFAGLAILCLSLLVFQYVKHRHSAQKVLAKNEAEKLVPLIHESMGEFRTMLKDAELRVDIDAECSIQETCDQLKEHMTEARDAIHPILESTSREEILNPDKKQQLRWRITEKLNDLKLPGKVLQVDFTDLSLEVAH